MASPASDRVGRLVNISGKQIHPFDWVNLPLFYDPKPEADSEYTNRLRAATRVAYIAANEVSQGVKFRFRPSSMSNGLRAYDLAVDYADKIRRATQSRHGEAYLTTQNLTRMVASSEMMNRVILPNREQDFQAANRIERRFADDGVVVPIEFENVPRTQRSDNALSQGATFQDWTFETWWIPRVIDSSGMVLGGDQVYSRYANMEDITGDLIQCGLLDDYREHAGPGREFDITDEYGSPVTLADRAWERAKHIVDVVERGFRSDLGVATLIAQFQIDDWLRNGDGPIDMDKVHPVLARRTQAELRRMDRLKEIMLPYIAEKCAGWVPYEQDPHLKPYFEKNVLPLQDQNHKLDAEGVKQKLFAYQPVGGYPHAVEGVKAATPKSAPRKAFAKAASGLTHVTRPAKRRSTDGGYFAKPARLFDDGHYGKLSIWEQAALPYLLGAMESFRLPENAPRTVFYACEPKGGERAAKFMEKHGVEWLREAQSAGDQVDSDETFHKDVMAANRAEAAVDAEELNTGLKELGVGNVVSTLNMHNIAEAVRDNREFVAAKGTPQFTARAFLALMMEWLDRNPQGLVLRPGWENHHDEVQLALRALLVATGLKERPADYEGGNYKMDILVYGPEKSGGEKTLHKQDLGDLVTTLGATVEKWLDHQPPVPAREHYVTMARMLQILDMHADPGRMNYEQSEDSRTGAKYNGEIIKWRNVDSELVGFWDTDPQKKAEVTALRDRVREKLLEVGVLHFKQEDLEGLHEDYAAAWREAHGIDALEQRRQYDGRRTLQRWPRLA